MESKKILIIAVAFVFLSGFFVQDTFANSGLKVNVNISKPSSETGSAEICIHGGGETICRDSTLGSGSEYQIQVQFAKGVVPDGGSIRGCVEFQGSTECDTTTNSDCKCPENVFVSFNGNEKDNGDRSSSSSSASSSSSSSSSATSSSSGNIVNIYPNDYYYN